MKNLFAYLFSWEKINSGVGGGNHTATFDK